MTSQPATTAPAWLTVGASAALIRSATHQPETVETVVIKTVAAKSFSTVNDRGYVTRWSFGTHGYSNHFSRSLGTWNGSEDLVALDHPRVVPIKLATNARYRLSNARKAFDAWHADPTDGDLYTKMVTALGAAQTAAEDAAAAKQ